MRALQHCSAAHQAVSMQHSSLYRLWPAQRPFHTRTARFCSSTGSSSSNPTGSPPTPPLPATAAADHGARSGGTTAAAAAVGGTSSSAAAAGPLARAVYLAPSEAHLSALAAVLAAERRPGDAYLLYGAVGAGKSTFSRAFVRAACEDPHLPVPSPTYLLQIIYDELEGPPIHHFDLYRLDQPQQQQQQQQQQPEQQQQQQQQQEQYLARLDLPSSLRQAVSLIEWPERLPASMTPHTRLEVRLEALPDSSSSSSSSSSDEQQQQQQQQQQAEDPLVIPLPAAAAAAAAAAAGGDAPWLDMDPDPSGGAGGEEGGPGDRAGGWSVDSGEGDTPDPFADSRVRRVELLGYGEPWRQRLQQLQAALRQQQQQQQQQE